MYGPCLDPGSLCDNGPDCHMGSVSALDHLHQSVGKSGIDAHKALRTAVVGMCPPHLRCWKPGPLMEPYGEVEWIRGWGMEVIGSSGALPLSVDSCICGVMH